MTQHQLLTIDQVAEMLSISARSVRRLVAQEQIPMPVRLGSLMRWPRPTLEKWIENGSPMPKQRRRVMA